MVAEPIVVQFAPLMLREAVTLFPLRVSRTQMFGAVLLLLLVVLTGPPVMVRRCQRQEPLPFTVSDPMRALFASIRR